MKTVAGSTVDRVRGGTLVVEPEGSSSSVPLHLRFGSGGVASSPSSVDQNALMVAGVVVALVVGIVAVVLGAVALHKNMDRSR